MSVRVKAKKGRVAFTAARGGKLIPSDRFITVDWSPWLERLLSHHGDIEVEPVKASAPAPVKAEKPKAETAPAA